MLEATAYITEGLTKKDKPCGVPVAFNNTHHECVTCKFRNHLVYFSEDYPGKKGLCGPCYLRREMRTMALQGKVLSDEAFNEWIRSYQEYGIVA
jgi:hypothetical protein